MIFDPSAIGQHLSDMIAFYPRDSGNANTLNALHSFISEEESGLAI